jgi:hypothetical protein
VNHHLAAQARRHGAGSERATAETVKMGAAGVKALHGVAGVALEMASRTRGAHWARHGSRSDGMERRLLMHGRWRTMMNP